MAVFLSPGVFTRETDLSNVSAGAGPIRPAFIGTAKKGPINQPLLFTSPQQAIDAFGTPFPESYLMYNILTFLQDGGSCFGMRIGVECEEGQADSLADICIDATGARENGWGRIPLFTGIDYGRINLRAVSVDSPLVFHSAAVTDTDYNDAVVSSTDGATSATISTTGTYTGVIDDSYVVIITSPPTVSDAAAIDGAGFEVVRNSDGQIVASGVLIDDNADGISNYVSIGDGLSIRVTVTSGVLDENDTFSFRVKPNNRVFSVAVEGGTANSYTMPAASYTTVSDFVDAFNALLTGEQYLMIEYTLEDDTTIPQLRSTVAGERIQIMTTQGWSLECGTQLYAWDIPRSYLLGIDEGPYDITSQNNRVKLNVIGDLTTKTVEFNVPIALDQTAASIASSVDAAGVIAGDTLWDSFALTVPGGTEHVIIVTVEDHQFDTLQLMASYSNLKTLHFAEVLNIVYPYKRAYRGFVDNRVTLPDSGSTDAATPLSCEDDPLSDECASDTAYFQNVVGWLVAPSPGTWIDDYTASLDIFTDGVGEVSGRYRLTIRDASGLTIDTINDFTFDKRDDRYIGNLVNPGSKFGGVNGNAYVNWDERPAFLDNDVNDLTTFSVRLPSQFNNKSFIGAANGIPTDPAYSSELDAALIGNPALSSGLYAFENPETYDIDLLVTPGFSSGAVIGTSLQLCENRGDVLYIVDPPFGLRPQQVVDWHNGILLSDLRNTINSSYGSLYWGWIKIFDQFNSDYIWVPPSGHVAGIYSRTARVAEKWFAPAGLRRGRMLTAIEVEYSPSLGERDLLYGSGNAVNPIVKFPQDGIVVWGQRTLQRSETALDRVNVRMLLNSIKKGLGRSLRDFVFEMSDRVTWRQVHSVVNPYLADIQSRRGLQAYKTICDETNNTPERQARHELWVSVFLKPTEVDEFVVLNLVTLSGSSNFSAEEVLAAGGIITAATSV